jgi:hypothetical protein
MVLFSVDWTKIILLRMASRGLFFVNDIEYSDSIKGGESLDYLTNYQLLKECSFPHS